MDMSASEVDIPVLPPRWCRTNYGISTGAPFGAEDQRHRCRCSIYPQHAWTAEGARVGAPTWEVELDPRAWFGVRAVLGPDGVYLAAPGYKLQRRASFGDFEEALRVANAYADRELHPEVVHQDVVRYAVVRRADTGQYDNMTLFNDAPAPTGAEFHSTWEAAYKRATRRNRALLTAAKRHNRKKENP